MLSNSHTSAFFGFVADDHPFRLTIDRCREELDGHPLAREIDGWIAGGEAVVHAEVKGVRNSDGTWSVARFYWSVQRSAGASAGRARRFDAPTLFYRRHRDEPGVRLFPDDPYLPSLPQWAGSRSTRVLRYVPLRRFTFVMGDGPGARVGKMRRQRTLVGSYERLRTASARAQAARAGFRVAEPLGMDRTRSVFFQSFLPGQNLAHLVRDVTVEPLLRTLGQIHAELHGLPSDGLAAWSGADYLARFHEDVAWIRLFRPECGTRLERIASLLTRKPPAPQGPVFCHGDLIPSQLLVDAGGWGVTDFDSARQGDRYQEMAKMLAALKYDVPALDVTGEPRGAPVWGLLARAEDSYLAGYRMTLDEDLNGMRLAWYRACAEIHYLAMALKKDAHTPARFDCGLEIAERSAERLG